MKLISSETCDKDRKSRVPYELLVRALRAVNLSKIHSHHFLNVSTFFLVTSGVSCVNTGLPLCLFLHYMLGIVIFVFILILVMWYFFGESHPHALCSFSAKLYWIVPFSIGVHSSSFVILEPDTLYGTFNLGCTTFFQQFLDLSKDKVAEPSWKMSLQTNPSVCFRLKYA